MADSDNCFFAATGITDGELLNGVRYISGGARTQSLVMRSKSGTVRMIDARHRIDKLATFAAVDATAPKAAGGISNTVSKCALGITRQWPSLAG